MARRVTPVAFRLLHAPAGFRHTAWGFNSTRTVVEQRYNAGDNDYLCNSAIRS